jgi:hypothetical protein
MGSCFLRFSERLSPVELLPQAHNGSRLMWAPHDDERMFPAASRIDAPTLELDVAAVHQIVPTTSSSAPALEFDAAAHELAAAATACLLEPLHGRAPCSSSPEIPWRELEAPRRPQTMSSMLWPPLSPSRRRQGQHEAFPRYRLDVVPTGHRYRLLRACPPPPATSTAAHQIMPTTLLLLSSNHMSA